MTETWNQYRLGDLFEIKHGYAFEGAYFSDKGHFVLLSPGNFREDGGLKLKGEKEKYYVGEVSDEYVLEAGDLLVAMTDLTQAAPILGSSASIPEGGRFLHNQRLGKIINIKLDRVVPQLIYYLFNLADVRAQIKGSASGATVRHTSPSRIYDVKVSLPAVPLQRRIVQILSAYDSLVANCLRRIEILEQINRRLYLELVSSPLHGKLSKGWRRITFGEIAQEVRTGYPKGALKQLSPYVGLEHIPRQSVVLDQWILVETLGSNKLGFKRGDVLFGKIRPYFHKVSIAPFDGICSADTIVIRTRKPEHAALIAACASSEEFVSQVSAAASGAKMPRASWDFMMKYEVVIPPDNALMRFGSAFGDIVLQQQNLIFEVNNLRRTRDLLLPKLLSGEIDLSCLIGEKEVSV